MAKTNMKLGIQMWSIHNVFVEQGIEKTAKEIRAMGYEGLEFALGGSPTLSDRCGYPVDPKEVRKQLLDNGVEPLGSHIAFGAFLEDPDTVLGECLDLGIKYAAIGPAFEGDRTPHEDQIEKYRQIAAAAKKFKENGIQFQVHCAVYGYLHDYKGRPTYQGMIEEAGVDLIQPEFDTAWMICSGNDPVELLEKYKGHEDILHFKDYHPIPYSSDYILVQHNEVCDHHFGCAVGDNGVQDVGQIVDAADQCGVKWVLTELWNEPNSMENAKISADNILKYL